MYVKWDYEETTPVEVGAKSYNLSELRRLGLRTPRGFTLTTKAFLDFIVACGVYDSLNRLLANLEPEKIKEMGEEMTRLFSEDDIPSGIIDELTSGCKILSAKTLAVRSSAVVEDLRQASFAGLYDTYLNVSFGRGLFEAVKDCWKSVFSLRVLTYLNGLNLPINGLKDMTIAVIIQEQIPARFAGVLFTVDPVTGDGSKISVEYSRGRERPVVSGESTPSSILIDKVTNQIDKKGEDLLDEGYIYKLATIGKRIEDYFGCYQDIEWVIDNDSSEIIILQARPETVWNIKHQRPFHKRQEWIFNFVQED